MLLFDEILQPQSIISLDCKIPQKVEHNFNIIFLDKTKIVWRKITDFLNFILITKCYLQGVLS